ncbi:hypothetical protein DUNSADRAFT_6972 [Dunaliella salina]|uniref:Uncharacterized protein n=1 Tax=Dunaliella salina TaxID=3046 RepID=A0ABQ7GM76_DUNSA|nr:hypothetical protein DUNSADRAFT_6972 [Dunaliella salina]|eukprot:KAF5835693.1 hypothetical protein DUNSADRAFT_6972 [Dunaliella salina]
MLRYPPSLPAKPKAVHPEPTPRSVVCGAFSRKPQKKLAYVSHPSLLGLTDSELSIEPRAGQQATNERGKLQQHAGGATYHEGNGSAQDLVFVFHERLFDRLLAYVELGVAAALQAIQHALGVLQMLLSSVAQRVGLEPTPQQAAGSSTASQVEMQQAPQHGCGQTSLQIQQRPRGLEHQHSKPQSLAPLAHMHSTTPSSNGAASSANMFTTAAQQRIATAVQGFQQSPAIAARFRAALAFDAVHLELPGIKESDVDPSDLVARVAGTSQGHPVELEGAIRKEWLQFMSASKVGLVTDLWDAKSKACNDNGPAASRAELEEMTRRVREANSITGGTRHRSIGEEQKAGAEAGDEDGWFLTKGDGRDSHPGPSSGHVRGSSYKDAQEAQIDMESMEERAARRRARMADQFASDEDVASMWTERRAGSANRPRPPLYHPPKAIPDMHSARASAQAAGSRSSAPLGSIPDSTQGTRAQVFNLEQHQHQHQRRDVNLDAPFSRSRELYSHSMGSRIQEVNPNTPSSHRAGGPHTKRLLRAQPLPPGTLPPSVFGATVQPWQLPSPTRPGIRLHNLPPNSACTPHQHTSMRYEKSIQHTSMLHEKSNQFGGIASDAMGLSDDALVAFGTEHVPVSHTVASGNSSSSNSSNSSSNSTSSRASTSEGVNTAEPEWGGMRTQPCAEELDVLAGAGSGRWPHQRLVVPSKAVPWQQGDLSSSIGYLSNGAAGQLEEHMKQDAVLFVASPEHTSPLLAARSSTLGSSSISSEAGMPPQSSTSSRATPPSNGMQTVPLAAQPTPTLGPSPVPSEVDATFVAAAPKSMAMEEKAGIQEGMREEEGRIASCSSTGKGISASPGAEKVEGQETQGQVEKAGGAVDAEARLARFMRRPTSRKTDQ